MRARSAYFVTVGVFVLASSWPLEAADPGTYREFRLGTRTGDVVAQAGAAPADVKTLHTRPALLEELSWRPRYTSGDDSTDDDSVAAIVFSFVDDQLFKMAIEYDKSRTEGLTNSDMIGFLSAVYGPRSTASVAKPSQSAVESLGSPTVLAEWRLGDTAITLQHSSYDRRFGLVILSVPLDARARKAEAAALTMDAREAPAREAARAQAAAEAEKAAAEKTRTANKAAFKP